MYAFTLVVGSMLAGHAHAAYQVLSPLSGAGLTKRQSGDQSFIPDTTYGCPDGWPICGTSNICYSPSRGDTCCPEGTYACPKGSFCLKDPYCCPDDLDKESCANKFGVTLQPTTTAESTASSSSSSTSSSTSSTLSTSSKRLIPTSTSSSSMTPIATTNSPAVPTTGMATGAATSNLPLFTGGANAPVLAGAAAVLGGLGMIGNLLI